MSKPVDIVQKKDLVVVEDLQMIYRVGKVEVPALRGVTLNVKSGEFVAIMGPSGCGKSTLLHLLGGLLRPSSGRIFIDGVDLASVSDAERTEIRRRKMGFVFQRFNLLPTLTAADNIDLARQIQGNGHLRDHQTTEEILSLLGIEDKMHHKPSELSGGEQQRVAIARAVINRPAILLADEPTGNLDSDNSQMVLQMLQELNLKYKQTIIMITHDSEAASTASRIVEMRDGRILNRVQNLFYAMEQKRV
jgi:putative ABC transport system ATP-binding protein